MSTIINRIYQTLLPLIVIAVGVQCYLTTMDNRKLKTEIQTKWTNPMQTMQMGAMDILKAGEKIKAFSAPDINGVERQIAPENSPKKTLLFAFTTSCPACKANSPNWVKLYEGIDKNKWDVVGLSLDDIEKTKAYVAEKGFTFPVLAMKEKKDMLSQLKIRRIPTTIALDEKQTVEEVWVGGLEPKLAEVNKKLGITK
jgi:peroxiredoxin